MKYVDRKQVYVVSNLLDRVSQGDNRIVVANGGCFAHGRQGSLNLGRMSGVRVDVRIHGVEET